MKNFNDFAAADARTLRTVLFDIDDTITSNGALMAEAYNALWALHDAGLRLIPVTGRPAGWCDMIIRQWPVDAVVGENGAFAFYRSDAGGYRELIHPNVTVDAQARLAAVRDACLVTVPGCRVARDQFARRYDLAIDFCEDEPRLGLDAAYAIQAVCEAHGAVAKVSSIHVNAWFGAYSKLEMTQLLMMQASGEIYDGNGPGFPENAIFFGDSPNDEPMFGYFPHSCGVANIMPFLDKMRKKPAYVTTHASGRGFAEAAAHLLKLRGTGTYYCAKITWPPV